MVRGWKTKRAVLLFTLTLLVGSDAALACNAQGQSQQSLQKNAAEMGQAEMNDGELLKAQSETRVRLSVADKTIILKLRDTPTAKALLAQLPLTLTLSDHADTEKILYLPKKLSTEGAPSGFDPAVGDVTYYAPWGNLAIFYRDFGYAKGLVPLGAVESGLKELAALDGDVKVTIERL